jgi:peptidoglycan LD-endopeptidase CwlK
MSLIRDIARLEPRTRDAAEKALAALKGVGIKVWVNETLRTPETQAAYYAQGREPVDAVNAKRRGAGLWLITQAENRVITQTLKSKHLEGKAIDLVPMAADGGPNWGADKREYLKIADVVKLFGFDWGGDWAGSWDKPHFQIKEPS